MLNLLSGNGEWGKNKMEMNIFLLIVNCIINVCNIIKCYISIIILLVFNINIYVDYKSILNI